MEDPAQQPAPILPPDTFENSQKFGHRAKAWAQSHKKLLISSAIVIVLGAGFVCWWLAHDTHSKNQGSTTSSSSSKTSTKSASSLVQGKSLKDLSIVYGAYKLGDKTTALYLQKGLDSPKKINININGANQYAATFGNAIAFVADSGIYLSTDKGETYKNIYAIDSAAVSADATPPTVTSLRFSTSGKRIIFALYGGKADSGNQVKSINISTGAAENLTSFSSAGVYILNYNDSQDKIIYQTGCYFCDGAPGLPHLLNLSSKADSVLNIAKGTDPFGQVVTSPDGNKLLYYVGTDDALIQSEINGPGYVGGPPYSVNEMNVSSQAVSSIASIGTLHEKDSDGKLRFYTIQLGYTADNHKPYYGTDTGIYSMGDSKFEKVLNASDSFLSPRYVSSKAIVYEKSKANISIGSYTYYLIAYDLSTKKQTTIYQADSDKYSAYFLGAL